MKKPVARADRETDRVRARVRARARTGLVGLKFNLKPNRLLALSPISSITLAHAKNSVNSGFSNIVVLRMLSWRRQFQLRITTGLYQIRIGIGSPRKSGL
jgi:hypothetical protein